MAFPCSQVQCFSEEDWNSLAEKFEECSSKLERSLLQTLREDFLPEIPRLFQEKEKVSVMPWHRHGCRSTGVGFGVGRSWLLCRLL